MSENNPDGGVLPVAASTIEELVGRADQALYAAKEGGRNRVAPADADSPR